MIIPIPTGTLIYFLIITVVMGAAVGLATDFVICRFWRAARRAYLASAILGAVGFLNGNFLAGWAWEGAVYVDGLPATWRTRLADQGFLLGVVLAVLLGIGWHLSAFILKRRATQVRPN